jgi:hypothetical protein
MQKGLLQFIHHAVAMILIFSLVSCVGMTGTSSDPGGGNTGGGGGGGGAGGGGGGGNPPPSDTLTGSLSW